MNRRNELTPEEIYAQSDQEARLVRVRLVANGQAVIVDHVFSDSHSTLDFKIPGVTGTMFNLQVEREWEANENENSQTG